MSTKSSNLYRQMLGYNQDMLKKLDAGNGSAWSVFSSYPVNPDGTLDVEQSWENQWMRSAYQEWALKEEKKRQEQENALRAQRAVNKEAADARVAAKGTTTTPVTTTTPAPTAAPPRSRSTTTLTTTPSVYYPSTSSAATTPASASLFTTPVSASTATGSLGKSINNSNTEVQGYLDTLRNAASSNITSAGNEVSNLNTRFQNANALTNRVLADEQAARERQAAELRAAELDSAASTLKSFFIEEGTRQKAEQDQRNLDMKQAEQKKRLTTGRRMLTTNTSGMRSGSFFGSVS